MNRLRIAALLFFAGILSACQLGHDAPAERGRAAFKAYKCTKCHMVAGEGGVLGPDLTFVGFRKSSDFLDRWLINPQAWKPHVSMPNFYLQDGVRKDIVAYLATLQGDEYMRNGRPWNAKAFRDDAVKRGEEIYNRVGCVTCHGKAGVGGYPNNNVVGGLIPAVHTVKDTYSREELLLKLRKGVRHPIKADPSGPEPLLYMPRWEAKLTTDELEALTDYLFSLGAGSDAETEEW
jgi:mono/diheme cytochrome c family protein